MRPHQASLVLLMHSITTFRQGNLNLGPIYGGRRKSDDIFSLIMVSYIERARRADINDFDRLLDMTPDIEPDHYDRLPAKES